MLFCSRLFTMTKRPGASAKKNLKYNFQHLSAAEGDSLDVERDGIDPPECKKLRQSKLPEFGNGKTESCLEKAIRLSKEDHDLGMLL